MVPPAGLPLRPLHDAYGQRYDFAIATWWETFPALFELQAERRFGFLQSFEQLFYTDNEPLMRLGAAAITALPVDFVVVSEWMRERLADLRPAARCRVVRNGVDKTVFGARRRERRDGPLRVLVEGQPTLWIKGVEQAVAAARHMQERAELTLVALDPPEEPVPGFDRVVGRLGADEMATMYADSDVLLKLSRVEGLALPPLEAFHAGVPCVVTPFGAHEEFVRHGQNGFVVGFDDVAGTARVLDRLACDRELLETLSAGALETAAGWPDERAASTAFAAAVTELRELPPPEAASGPTGLLREIQLAVSLSSRGAGGAEVERANRALAEARALVHELSSSRDECAERLHAALDDLERIRSSLPYRVAAKARAALRMGAR
jgi:O-antigen biosynthesis protein